MQRSIIAPAERVTNLRWAMALLVGFGILVAACDQAGVAVNAGALQTAFGIDDAGLGYLLSAFGWAFAIAQIPFGLAIDRLGAARTGRIWSIAWAVVSLAGAFATTFGLLVGARALLGIAQAPALPTSAKAVGYWFPVNERSTGTAVFDGAHKLGLAIGIPLMTLICATYGWQAMFVVSGVAGLIFAAAWFVWYRDPAQSRSLTHAEQQHLARGGAQGEGTATGINVLAQRNAWGATIGAFAYAFAFFLFVTWLPAYLARTFHLGTFPSVTAAALPWLIAAIADVAIGGWVVDALVKSGANGSVVRKSVLVIGMLLGLAVFGAVAAHDRAVALICIGVAITGLGISGPIVWSLPSLIAARGRVGALASMMNCAAALGAISAPIAAGYILRATANFDDVFIAAAAVLLIGIVSYVFVLGRIEPSATAEPAGIVI